ncbi:hypothetical protein [Pontibacter ruber]|uniref:YD repeat-containing protein n=1 Tax=Pontibacter ruber TaxID=1343895 RepID=A0ABW5D296_9BACT|nr:hypothetical protein [Pontibacter ruber]
MKTPLHFFLVCLLLLVACKHSPEPAPAPTQTPEILGFPVSITSAGDDGVNEIFYYDRTDRYGELSMREYFTRTDTVHHFDIYLGRGKDMLNVIERRDHSLSDSIKDYVTIDHMSYDLLPLRRNERPYYPLNNLLIDAHEIYKYTPSYVLAEQQFYKDYKLTGTRKYNYGSYAAALIEEYSASGTKTRTLELHFDEKRHPQANNVKYQKILVEPGYPHDHNITQVTARDAGGAVLESKSYSNTYTYNEHGYPLQVVRTFLDGRSNTYTYTYKCR